MHLLGTELILSASDLSNFLSCRHRTALDMAVVVGDRDKPFVNDPLVRILWERGIEHERRYVEKLRDEGLALADLTNVFRDSERVEKTLEEMRRGADVIIQGALRDGQWFGKPDILRRVRVPSALGA